jgi:hypothetical protein
MLLIDKIPIDKMLLRYNVIAPSVGKWGNQKASTFIGLSAIRNECSKTRIMPERLSP